MTTIDKEIDATAPDEATDSSTSQGTRGWMGFRSWTDVVITLSAISTASLAGVAYFEYVKANTNSDKNRLADLDQALASKIYDFPELAHIYDIPGPNSGSELQGAQQIVAVMSGWSSQDAAKYFLDVPSFSCNLWHADSTHRTDRLVRSYFFAEAHLYLIDEAYRSSTTTARWAAYFLDSNEYLDSYSAYLSDVGDNPIFLAAFYEGVRYGYLKPESAQWIRDKILAKANHDQIKAVFPVLADDIEWAKFFQADDPDYLCPK